ncbi:putative abc1 domain protein [Diplogelasinospora grovesii]|uniref:Abc1 domain protein n=1 Tax=Diplogelasinospora grovesii TaxID=303347 RepID=A0AAN6NHW0_9PEZI|nr:putative abc1 domain protein [Diplogelasinospora grovesii]
MTESPDGTDREDSLELASNEFRKRYMEWRVSPPPLKRRRQRPATPPSPPALPAASTPPSSERRNTHQLSVSTAAAIEAGEVKITDHSTHFSDLLSRAALPNVPRLSVAAYKALYDSSINNEKGAHFVIHQHDHPVAGTHYDLRLQINGTSSASWAIMYGLPGNPNSVRLSRNATETRVHCLWNHLIESASAATGSLIIWDTGTYTVLPLLIRGRDPDPDNTDDDDENDDGGETHDRSGMTEQQKLHTAFAARKIRLQLNGARLPKPYVINMRLTTEDDIAGRSKVLSAAFKPPRSRRRRTRPSTAETSSDSSESEDAPELGTPDPSHTEEDTAKLSAMERELRELEDEEVRRTNAYPGANNTIGSVHQRRWFVMLDRVGSGFRKTQKGGKTTWEPDPEVQKEKEKEQGPRASYPFYVRGPDHERSIVTGRLAADVVRDEGVKDFKHRKGWRAVLN